MDFDKLVEQCLEKNRDQVIHNASMEHAKILFRTLLRAAETDAESVKIVTYNLNNNFYGDLVDVGESCLESGGTFEVVVLNPDADLSDNSFACMVKRHTNGTIIQIVEALNDFAHFIVVGDKRYRFETDHGQTKAVANFNDSSVGEVLVERFDLLKEYIKDKGLSKKNAPGY